MSTMREKDTRRRTRRWLGVLMAAMAAVAISPGRVVSARECQLVTDFAHNVIGAFPGDWKPRTEEAREVYLVYGDGRNQFVRGTAGGSGVQMGRAFDWDLTAHPVLTWRWRPHVFPTGSDERRGDRNDSALGVYAVFRHGVAAARTIKYVWSRSVPVGVTASASMGLTRIVVARSGQQPARGWVGEVVDVARDYARLFGEAANRPWGIAILTDSDDTRSRAVGDYAAFSVCPPGRASHEGVGG
jgi:hypothetical protein